MLSLKDKIPEVCIYLLTFSKIVQFHNDSIGISVSFDTMREKISIFTEIYVIEIKGRYPLNQG